MTSGQNTPEHVVLNAAGITQVEIVAPQNEMLLLEFCAGAAQPALYQGGIIAVLVFGELINIVPPSGPGITALRGDPALAVRNNSVVTPSGQALFAIGLGPMAITSNSLTCLGRWTQPIDSAQATAIHILNIGRSFSIPQTGFGGLGGIDPSGTASAAALQDLAGVDGRVQFHDNQVTCRPMGTAPPTLFPCAVLTLDDASIQANQFLAEPISSVVSADVFALGATVRVLNNRISEIPFQAAFSCLVQGFDVMVSLNQTMHCIGTFGTRIFDPAHTTNQIAINIFCSTFNNLFD
jgi:hypothetical protein